MTSTQQKTIDALTLIRDGLYGQINASVAGSEDEASLIALLRDVVAAMNAVV